MPEFAPACAGVYEALLRDVLRAPGEDTPRLILADWLEDHGGAEGERRAVFIRQQCESARLTAPGAPPGVLADFRLLELRNETQWLLQWELDRLRGVWRRWDGPDAALWWEAWDLARGFVSFVSLPCADFLRHAEALFRSQPVERVELTDREPVATVLSDGRPGPWGLVAGPQAVRPEHSLPPCVWRYMRPLRQGAFLEGRENEGCRFFATRQEGRDAISSACVRYGRRLAGLEE